MKVKIVRARLTYAHNGKPNFENIDVIFVDIHKDTAYLGCILRAVQEQFGPHYAIVSNDGLEKKMDLEQEVRCSLLVLYSHG